jgi:hypothetical protein
LTASWPIAFLWTLALELPIYVLVLGRRFDRWWSVCLLTLAINVATHPALWLLFPYVEPGPRSLLLAESAVTAVEAALIAAVLRRSLSTRPAVGRALAAAAAANTFSTLVGLACA